MESKIKKEFMKRLSNWVKNDIESIKKMSVGDFLDELNKIIKEIEDKNRIIPKKEFRDQYFHKMYTVQDLAFGQLPDEVLNEFPYISLEKKDKNEN